MAKLTFLGTSCAIPTRNRDNTSLVLNYKGKIWLIDCPGAIEHKLCRVDLDFKIVQNVIITHTHPDHIYGIVSLVHAQAKFNDNLSIYGSQETLNLSKKLIKLFQLNKEGFPKMHYHKIDEGIFSEEKGLRLSSFRVDHIKSSRGISLEFLDSAKRVVCSSDTKKSNSLMRVAYGADILIHDCFSTESFFEKYPQLYSMHTSSRILAEFSEKLKIKTLIPIHFYIENKKDMNLIKEEIKKYYSGRIIIPEDLESIEI